MQRDLANRRVAKAMDPLCNHTTTKEGDMKECENYRTISLISHDSKVILRIATNRLQPQADVHIAEKQAGFRAGSSTVEQIFNLRILCEK